MFGIVEGTNKRGMPCRVWTDDIVSWCKSGLQELNSLAQDRRRWKLITRQEMDTNGHWSHGSGEEAVAPAACAKPTQVGQQESCK